MKKHLDCVSLNLICGDALMRRCKVRGRFQRMRHGVDGLGDGRPPSDVLSKV